MKNKTHFLFVFLFLGTTAFGQWSNSGNNYTTGKVGIGINNTTGKKLYVKQTSNDHSALFTSDNGNGVIIHSHVDPLRIGSAGNSSGNLLIIDESGTVGINTGFSFNTGYKLHTVGSGYFTGSLAAYTMYSNGYFSLSDRRLKTDIKEDFSSYKGLYDIKTYNYELKSENNGKRHYGVMAQEVAEVYPDLVSETLQNELAVNYIELVPHMIRALQEQKQMISALESKVANLMSELESVTGEKGLNQTSLIYPNPTSGNVQIQLSGTKDIGNASIQVYNLNGEIILSKKFQGKTSLSFDTSNLIKGTYFVRVLNEQNIIETRKLLVK